MIPEADRQIPRPSASVMNQAMAGRGALRPAPIVFRSRDRKSGAPSDPPRGDHLLLVRVQPRSGGREHGQEPGPVEDGRDPPAPFAVEPGANQLLHERRREPGRERENAERQRTGGGEPQRGAERRQDQRPTRRDRDRSHAVPRAGFRARRLQPREQRIDDERSVHAEHAQVRAANPRVTVPSPD